MNEQEKEFIRKLAEEYKSYMEQVETNKRIAVSDIENELQSDKFWQYIAKEMDKRIGESELKGKYATDIAKKMFSTLPKGRIDELIDNYLKCCNSQ